jgi:hypothetical protein
MGDGSFELLYFLDELLYRAYHELANTQWETAFFPKNRPDQAGCKLGAPRHGNDARHTGGYSQSQINCPPKFVSLRGSFREVTKRWSPVPKP